MVEIGGRPILWHVMMHYYHYGHKEFAIALGYKGEVIKKYMVDYCSLNSNITIDFKNRDVRVHEGDMPDWKVELIDTGFSIARHGRSAAVAP